MYDANLEYYFYTFVMPFGLLFCLWFFQTFMLPELKKDWPSIKMWARVHTPRNGWTDTKVWLDFVREKRT